MFPIIKKNLRNSRWKIKAHQAGMRSRLRKDLPWECNLVSVNSPAKNEPPGVLRHASKRLFKVACVIAAICCSAASLAKESLLTAEREPTTNHAGETTTNNASKPDASPNGPSSKKDPRTLKGLQLGVFRSRAEVEEVAAKLRQLDFETLIIQVKNGYVVSAGAFSSKANLERAIRRLDEAGLADKARVVEIATKHTQAIAPVKTRDARSPLFGAKTPRPHDKDTGDEYVPKKDYEKLKREVEVLKAQMLSLVTKGTPSERSAKPTADTTRQAETESADTPGPEESPQAEVGPPAEGGPQTNDGFDVAEGSRKLEADESRRELDTFLRGQKVLFKRGELQLEYNLAYSQDTTDSACFDADFSDSRCPTGSEIAPKFRTRSVDTGLLARYGLADNLELDLTVPYGYIEQEQDFRPFDVLEPVRRSDSAGIGDVSGALRYTAWPESGTIPNITLSLNAKSKTGKQNPFNENTGTPNPGLGTGFWNVGAAMTLVKTIDPVVFFGSLGYTTTLEEGGIDPGDQISYALGTGFSMNDRVSFSTSLSGALVMRTEVNGRGIAGSSTNNNSLQLSSTIQLTKRLFVEPFVGFGLTEEANDFVVGFNVPYRFERRFPLPFFHD